MPFPWRAFVQAGSYQIHLMIINEPPSGGFIFLKIGKNPIIGIIPNIESSSGAHMGRLARLVLVLDYRYQIDVLIGDTNAGSLKEDERQRRRQGCRAFKTIHDDSLSPIDLNTAKAVKSKNMARLKVVLLMGRGDG